MGTLVHLPLTHGAPPLRLLERPPARRAPASVNAPSLLERLEAAVARLPEPTQGHRLGSWTALR